MGCTILRRLLLYDFANSSTERMRIRTIGEAHYSSATTGIRKQQRRASDQNSIWRQQR
jgi:hypothetical protein